MEGMDPCLLKEGKPGLVGDMGGTAPKLKLRGRVIDSGAGNCPVVCLRNNGRLSPPSDVLVTPSVVSPSLVLVTFSSEDVIGPTLLANGRPAVAGKLGRSGGGWRLEILRERIGWSWPPPIP